MKIYKILISKSELPLLVKRLGSIPYVTIGDDDSLEVRVALSKEEFENVKNYVPHNKIYS